ncbi:pentapeptide repeat-containing protein [Arthrobacter cryoconiti]|uniref:Pentapeptide repeat-containing protein n=1 Tax=Arthrobacter cryoconiti TaxID=748907 RepID=A0ABV8QY33_9MICC
MYPEIVHCTGNDAVRFVVPAQCPICIRQCRFRQARNRQCRFTQDRYRQCRFRQARFRQCRFTQDRYRQCRFRQATFRQCRSMRGNKFAQRFS